MARKAAAPKAASAKTAAVKPVSAPKAAQAKSSITIDHPKEGEVLTHPTYTIKISTNAHGAVSVSIDGGHWSHCRHDSGNWWFDWGNYPRGDHKLVARAVGHDGKEIAKTPARNCSSR